MELLFIGLQSIVFLRRKALSHPQRPRNWALGFFFTVEVGLALG
jgi:hypothetical protein